MKTRASNIELLRIVSMLMICVLHLCTSIKIDASTITPEWMLWNLNKTLTISATSIFVLISGYFGIRFSFRKVLSLYLQCFIWGLLGYLAYSICANTPPRKNNNIIRSSSCLYAQQILVYKHLSGVNVFSSDTQRSNRVF